MDKIKKLSEEVSNLNFEIKSKSLKLQRLRSELLSEMIKNSVNKQNTEKGIVTLYRYKSKYVPYLKREFKKLSEDEKYNLFKTGILKISYRLNTKKYQELKDRNENTLLDEFIKIRENGGYYSLNIKLDPKLLNQLKSEKDVLNMSLANNEKLFKNNENFEQDEIDEIDEDIIDQIENQFIDPDYLSNFIDDDIADLNETDRKNIGLDD